jgi:hypothetical protein
METNSPDRMNQLVLFMLAILGFVIGVVGLYRYFVAG